MGFTLPWAGVTPAPNVKRKDAGFALFERGEGDAAGSEGGRNAARRLPPDLRRVLAALRGSAREQPDLSAFPSVNSERTIQRYVDT